jgi:hypothetical protein
MIAEFLRAATTPCRWHLRRLGYLGEAIGLEARYRRCRAAWQPHIEACRALIADAAHSCRNHRRAVVLGSGGLNDVPLAELAATFDEVVLADIAHLPQTARLIRPYRNVRQLAFDATGLVAGLWRMPAGAALPAPTDTLSALNADFLVSPNLLVQLPVMPGRLLERQGGPAPEIAAFCRSLAQANLDGLRAATTSGAVVCLISEVCCARRMARSSNATCRSPALSLSSSVRNGSGTSRHGPKPIGSTTCATGWSGRCCDVMSLKFHPRGFGDAIASPPPLWG